MSDSVVQNTAAVPNNGPPWIVRACHKHLMDKQADTTRQWAWSSICLAASLFREARSWGAYQVSKVEQVEPSDVKWGRKFLIAKPSPSFPVLAGRGEKKKITNWLPHCLQWAQRAAPLILPSYRRKSFPNSREKGLYINWYGAHSDSKELPDFPRADDLRLNIKRFECVGTVKEMEPWPCVRKREQQKRQKQNQKRLESKVSLIFLWWLLNRSTWDNGRYFKVATSNAQNGKLHAAVHGWSLRFVIVICLCRVKEFHSHMQAKAARSQNWASAWVNLQFWQKKKKQQLVSRNHQKAF